MSVIPTNPFAPEPSAAGLPFDIERSVPFAPSAPPEPADAVTYGPWRPPFAPGVPAGAPSDSASFSSIVGAIVQSISALFSQLSSLLGFANSGGASVNAPSQTAFAHATASSTGDPHEAFDGVRRDGTHAHDTWDSMTSHADLLSSDSIPGGYRVSTRVTQPNANGVTLNASATVTLDGGATTIVLDRDGTAWARSFGRDVPLASGAATALGDGATVTRDADGSLTVTASGPSGASLATTLRTNGNGGVDVATIANGADLGGYLVSRSDDAPQPVWPQAPYHLMGAPDPETRYDGP
jgi:hypothetical protein